MTKAHYSGDLSRPFWRRVKRLKKQHDEMYSLGVVLQNLEGSVLHWLRNAEHEQRAAEKRKAK